MEELCATIIYSERPCYIMCPIYNSCHIYYTYINIYKIPFVTPYPSLFCHHKDENNQILCTSCK